MRYTILFIFLLFTSLITAQQETIVPDLNFNPSPQAMAMGSAGVSNITNEPLGYYFNPAILGYSSLTNNFAFQRYEVNPGFYTADNGGEIKASAFSLGYNFRNIFKGANLSAGIGYISYKARANQFPHDYEFYDTYTAGFSFDYYASLSFGISYKKIAWYVGTFDGDPPYLPLEFDAFDWGMLIDVPVSNYAIPNYYLTAGGNTSIYPLVNFSLGYSRCNSGKQPYYYSAENSSLPLTARLGYTISLGADLEINKFKLNVVRYDLITEADDILFHYKDNNIFSSPIVYEGILGDINVYNNLIRLKGSDKVTLIKAHRLSFLETVSIMRGSSFASQLEGGRYSYGLVITTNGMFKLLSRNSGNNVYIKYLFDHSEVQYIRADYFANSNFETKLQTFAFIFKGLSL